MNKVVKVLKTIGKILLIAVAALIVILMALNLAIRPASLKKIVEKYSCEYLDASIKADTIELHLLKNFPFASLSIKNCEIISKAFDSLDSASRASIPSYADTLASFSELSVAVDVPPLLFNKLKIRKVEMVQPIVNGYKSAYGKCNWDIVKMQTDTTEQADSSSMAVSLNRLAVKGGASISLESAPDSIQLDLDLRELSLRGKFSTVIDENNVTRAKISRLTYQFNSTRKVIADSSKDNALKFSIDSLSMRKRKNSDMISVLLRTRTDMRIHGISVARNIPFDAEGRIEMKEGSDDRLDFNIEDLILRIATIPLEMKGRLSVDGSGVEIPELSGRINGYNIKELFAYIPESFLDPDRIRTDASINVAADVKGRYDFKSGEMPVVDFSFAIPQSTIELRGSKEGQKAVFKNVEADMNLHFDQKDIKANNLNINKFSIEGRGIGLNVSGSCKEYTKDPVLNFKASAAIDLDTLSAIIKPKDGTVAGGDLNGKFSLAGKLSDLNLFALSKNTLSASLSSDSLLLDMPSQGIFLKSGKAELFAGMVGNSKDSLIQNGKKVLNLEIALDTLNLNYKDSMFIAGKSLKFTGNQEAPKALSQKEAQKMQEAMKANKNRRHEGPTLTLHGNLEIGGLKMRDIDSTSLSLRKAGGSFSITPWTDGKTPVASLALNSRVIGTRSGTDRFMAMGTSMSVKAIMHRPKFKVDSTRRNRQHNLDSLRMKRRMAAMKDSAGTPEFNLKMYSRMALRNWDISGTIKSTSGRVITPSFPLRTRFSNFNLDINNNGMEFKDTRLNLGKSSIALSGTLQGFADAVTRKGKLSFTGKVTSDSLNIDELMLAYTKGLEFQSKLAQGNVQEEMVQSDENLEKVLQESMDSDTTQIKSPVIPETIAVDINLDLNRITTSEKIIDRLSGNLIVRNCAFQMNAFQAAIKEGTIDLNAFYAAKKIDDISAGFDFRMNNFEVAELIDLIPKVDTLLPMLSSFEGKVTCAISAMTKVDSLLNLQMNTVNGYATLVGENMVLMDGETFTDIARKLRFKNRDKNLIDKISVQAVIADNKIEIFPFVLTMDRYKAAISGTQNLDMSFNYHISVLKSPIPFRIGLTVHGTPDKMKFKIGRCLYKSEDVPVYTELLDSARVNLRNQIKDIFISGVERAVSNSSAAALARKAAEEGQKSGAMTELSADENKQLDSGTENPEGARQPADSTNTENGGMNQ